MKRVFRTMAPAWVSLCVAAAGCNSRSAPPPAAAEHAATTVNAPTTAPAMVEAPPTPTTSPIVAVEPKTTLAPVRIDPREALAYLASDEMEGRGIGTKGLERAADYIAGQFARIGLRPPPGDSDFFQSFEMTTATQVGPATALRVGDRTFDPKEEFTPVVSSGEGKFDGLLVFAGYGITSDAHHYDDYADIDVKGKIVLAMRYEPHDEKGNSRFDPHGFSDAAAIAAKAKRAHELGAHALLLVTPPRHHEDDNLIGLARRSPGEKPVIPILHVRQTVAEELLRRGGGAELAALQDRIDRDMKAASFALADVSVSGQVDLVQQRVAVKNVIGILPGERTDEYVVVGAHYDHLGRGGIASLARKRQIHNGADDNASGATALMMLAARLASGQAPERSIIFVAFTGEEEGLVGSSQFVKDPPVPLSQIAAMLNLDMVGRVRPPQQEPPRTEEPMAVGATTNPATRGAHGSGAHANAAHATTRHATTRHATTRHATTQAATAPSASHAAAATTQSNDPVLYVGGAGTAATFDKIVQSADARSPLQVREIGRGGLGPSDHMTFAQKKIPVLFFFTGLHADYHRPSDDAEKINYDGIDQVVDFGVDMLRQLASMPKQQYVDAADASSMRVGMPGGVRGGGPRVTLGVVPDYSAFGEGGGVLIGGTSGGSPAAAAGLKAGDVLVQFNEQKLDTLQDLSDVLARSKPGQKVKLKLFRDKKPIEVEVTLAARKD